MFILIILIYVGIKEAGMDWIFHLDTDELLYPAGTNHYSVQELLSDVPAEVDTIVFTNYVSNFTYYMPFVSPFNYMCMRVCIYEKILRCQSTSCITFIPDTTLK